MTVIQIEVDLDRWEVAEQDNGTLAVYANDRLIAYILDRKVNQIRNTRRFVDTVCNKVNRVRSDRVQSYTYKQLYR